MTITLEILTSAIRSGATIEELQRMVGPTEAEIAAANFRLSQLDVLSEKCEWHLISPSYKAQQAREQFERIMQAQTVYENTYL